MCLSSTYDGPHCCDRLIGGSARPIHAISARLVSQWESTVLCPVTCRPGTRLTDKISGCVLFVPGCGMRRRDCAVSCSWRGCATLTSITQTVLGEVRNSGAPGCFANWVGDVALGKLRQASCNRIVTFEQYSIRLYLVLSKHTSALFLPLQNDATWIKVSTYLKIHPRTCTQR